MRFTPTPLAGAVVIDITPHEDARGFFARTVCREAFAARGLNGAFVQQSISWNPHKGTLRGLHFQASPHAEEKLVRVTRGEIYDAIVDLRPQSATFGKHFSVVLSATNRRQLYVPKGFAHGFQTLDGDTEVLYEMTEPFHGPSARGIRWNDPALGIAWPFQLDETDRRRISDEDCVRPFWLLVSGQL